MACTETNLPSSSRTSKTALLVVAVPKGTVSSHSKNKKITKTDYNVQNNNDQKQCKKGNKDETLQSGGLSMSF
jgi:hypothetical protein